MDRVKAEVYMTMKSSQGGEGGYHQGRKIRLVKYMTIKFNEERMDT
jgi:hypothetical protein